MASLHSEYGYFSDDGREYVITRADTPMPWINVICNGDYGMTLSQAGSGYSWRGHAGLNRITRWEQDLIRDEWGKYIFIREAAAGGGRGEPRIWSAGWKPVCREPEAYQCEHATGYTLIESRNFGIETALLMFVPAEDPLELWHLTVRNRSKR